MSLSETPARGAPALQVPRPRNRRIALSQRGPFATFKRNLALLAACATARLRSDRLADCRLRQQIEAPERLESIEDAERLHLRSLGRDLMRQDRLEELFLQIRTLDAERAATPGGHSKAALLAEGARSDIVCAAREMAADGLMAEPPSISGAMELMQALQAEHPDDYAIAVILALTHMDIAWAWRGPEGQERVPPARQRLFEMHFARAARVLEGFCGIELNAPLLASACCDLLATGEGAKFRVAGDFEDLIDLDPCTPAHMRALGLRLLPRRFGSYGQLEEQARFTAERTADIWGDGAYAWVYLDALCQDDGAVRLLDTGYLLKGVEDILARRPDQHVVNLWAAFCGLMGETAPAATGDPDLAGTRAALRGACRWIVADHLREIHPNVWANIRDTLDPEGRVNDPRKRIDRARHDALRTIAAPFKEALADGARLRLTPQGPVIEPQA